MNLYDHIIFVQATTLHMQEVWASVGEQPMEDLREVYIGDSDVLIETYYLQEDI